MSNVRLILAFVMGFGMGGVSLHYAHAQGFLGLTGSVKQIGSALVEMQKNVDDLQKNMGTIKQAKEQLMKLSLDTGTGMPQEGESIKKIIPGFGQ
jgi:hypothetical protein